ncbi:DUF86 domain-containing protein [Halanaerobium sp. MA284_MarDTE_T2]|uniref:type VII toxin-antitoxin system HepT family RNase toxin n=1 Tax=Halanaerobium sp. MA284_MarDTE_T2 TaxID=2183913 RepID=UPI000DF4B52D|nr:DUF86 domain-containing protein [Halanaerobium sp. MA284_MarDTE_T2]RCW44775.1 uncharacterized protein YutE (UPF0331/DUF86 family) [Halanaerobium sp. MA284_MarDTE_T2]
MTLDYNRLTEKIQFIRSNMKKLRELAELPKENFLSDYRNYDTAKYNLQSIIEAMIDIANHIISREELGNPDTNADSFRIIADTGLIEEELLSTFIKMTKFRNRIVHLYDQIDDEYIYHIIKNNLEDIDTFIEIIIDDYFQ